MSKPVTIDNLPSVTHERYAKDKEVLESKFVDELAFLSEIAEIASIDTSYESQFDLLFGTHLGYRPWAKFSEPKNKRRKRLFSRRGLIPGIEAVSALEDFHRNLDEREGELYPGEERIKCQLEDFLETFKELSAILNEAYSKLTRLQRG